MCCGHIDDLARFVDPTTVVTVVEDDPQDENFAPLQENLKRLRATGLNIVERTWKQLTPAGAEQVIDGNLSSAFYCSTAVLPIMRKHKGGVLIHTASMAGRQASILSGAAYSAAKHGVVAMSHTINMEECVNGIRSCVVCPGEVATPILDKRPVPVSKEDRAKMLQSVDCGDLIRYVIDTVPGAVGRER